MPRANTHRTRYAFHETMIMDNILKTPSYLLMHKCANKMGQPKTVELGSPHVAFVECFIGLCQKVIIWIVLNDSYLKKCEKINR